MKATTYIEMSKTQVDTLIQSLLDQLSEKNRTIEYQRERIDDLEKQLADIVTKQVQAKEDDF